LSIISTTLFCQIKEIRPRFVAISVSGKINVVLKKSLDTTNSIIFADDLSRRLIKDTVNSGELKISLNQKKLLENKVIPSIVILYYDLEEINVSNYGHITSNDSIYHPMIEIRSDFYGKATISIVADEARISCNSNSKCILNGTVNHLILKSSNGSTLNCGNIEALEADAKAEAGGKIILKVLNKLVGSTHSGGSIKCLNEPKENLVNNERYGQLKPYKINKK
jgi:hypothetical protein